MEDDFRILKTGSELAGNGSPKNSGGNNINWLLIGFSVIGIIGATVVAYQHGRNSIMPALGAANIEKERLTKEMGNCPVYKKALSSVTNNAKIT